MIGLELHLDTTQAQKQWQKEVKLRYDRDCDRIIMRVTLKTKGYRKVAAKIMYNYIEQLVGEDRAPKVTGMMMKTPDYYLREVLESHDNLENACKAATKALNVRAHEYQHIEPFYYFVDDSDL